MPGKARLHEIVAESLQDARVSASTIEDTARHPQGRTTADVDRSERLAKEAIGRAAEAARVLVSEEGG